MSFFGRKRKTNSVAKEYPNAAGEKHHPQFLPQIKQKEHVMLENKSSRLVARINLSGSPDTEHYVDIFEHDLLTFGIDEMDVPILSALHLDVMRGFESEKRWPGCKEHFDWLRKTHPHTAATVDLPMYRRWEDLVFFLTGSR